MPRLSIFVQYSVSRHRNRESLENSIENLWRELKNFYIFGVTVSEYRNDRFLEGPVCGRLIFPVEISNSYMIPSSVKRPDFTEVSVYSIPGRTSAFITVYLQKLPMESFPFVGSKEFSTFEKALEAVPMKLLEIVEHFKLEGRYAILRWGGLCSILIKKRSYIELVLYVRKANL